MKKLYRFLLFVLGVGILLACNLVGGGGTPTAVIENETPASEPTLTMIAPETAERPPTEASPTEPEPTRLPVPTPMPPAEHPIQIRQVGGTAEFYDTRTNERFVPRGVNYFYIVPTGTSLQDRFFGLDTFDAERVAADFALLKEHGYNTMRIFLDSCNGGTGCTGNPNGDGLNPPYLDNIVETMRLAQEAGIFLLLTSNDLPEQGGYWALVDTAVNEQFGPYRNSHYLTGPGVEAGRRYWQDLMSGLVERSAPFEAVWAWSLLNEQWYFNNDPPFSLESGLVTTANGHTYDMADPEQKRQMAVESVNYYIEELKTVILAHDPNALITMGFFVPDYPNPIRQGDFRYVETAPLLATAPLDFFDFHGYPGDDMFGPLAENYGLIDYAAKPVVLGEVGAFIDRYFSAESAGRAIKSWIAESCQAGFDGFLYWGMYRAPEAIGDATWSLLDEEQTLLRAFSAAELPDPCDPALLPPENLALNKAVTASQSLPEERPEFAVDGQPTQWGSGGHPVQWIEIDLGQSYEVGLVRLVVAQFPEGETIHQVWGRGPGEELRLLHEFGGNTAEGDVLEFRPEEPLAGIQYIRIVTTSSPSWVSWKEVEVYGVEEFNN
jgi:hypothetical protein